MLIDGAPLCLLVRTEDGRDLHVPGGTCPLPDERPMCASNPRIDGQPWEPWEGNGPCQDCGARNVVWTTESATWRAVMGDAGGLLCPSCFVIRAHKAGMSVMWRLVPDVT